MKRLKKKRLTLIRHGALDPSLDGCYVGRLDVTLSKAGKKQAESLADRLDPTGIEVLWCSPSRRAQETVQPLTDCLKVDCHTLPELDEVNFGRWEGLTFEQIKVADPDLVNDWADLKEGFSFPEGESHADFQQRIEFVAQSIEDCHHKHLALVTHGGVISRLLCKLVGWPKEDYLKIKIERGGFVTLNLHDQGAVLTGLYND